MPQASHGQRSMPASIHAEGCVEGEALVGGRVAANDVGPGNQSAEHDHAHDGDE